MKNVIVSIIVFFVFLFFFAKWGPGIPFSVSQITTNKADLFTVSAEGKVVAIPDTAQISLGVQTQGSTVKAAQDSANKIINNITAAVKAIGVDDKDIKTTNYSVYPDEQFTAPEPMILTLPPTPTPISPPRKVTRYRVNINLSITVRDFAKINEVIDAATANGANQIGGISFSVDNIEDFQSQARKIAITKAKAKAASIAKDAGITLGKIINVSEGFTYNPPYLMTTAAKAETGGGTQIQPGSSEISVTITLSYEVR